MLAPARKPARHFVGQEIPPGVLVTRPFPVTLIFSVGWTTAADANALAATMLAAAIAATGKTRYRRVISDSSRFRLARPTCKSRLSRT